MAGTAVKRVRGAGGTRTVTRRAAKTAWSARKERLFLDTLAATSNVSASAKAAKVSDTSVYRRRQNDPAFAAAWTRALCEGYARLELALLERAIQGVPREVAGGDGKTVTTRDFSERLGLALLAHHGKAVGEERARVAALSAEARGPGPVQALIDRLADLSARLAGPDGAAEGDGDAG